MNFVLSGLREIPCESRLQFRKRYISATQENYASQFYGNLQIAISNPHWFKLFAKHQYNLIISWLIYKIYILKSRVGKSSCFWCNFLFSRFPYRRVLRVRRSSNICNICHKYWPKILRCRMDSQLSWLRDLLFVQRHISWFRNQAWIGNFFPTSQHSAYSDDVEKSWLLNESCEAIFHALYWSWVSNFF